MEHAWNADFDKFVAHYRQRQSPQASRSEPESGIETIGADMGRSSGFQRIAAHHVTLPPGKRSSLPHAESLEEEFVLVLSGNPHLWLNGYLHQLQAGHAVGFPAGTGIGHTFLNNSESEVQLLVAGERTKPNNFCAFPINPEQKDSCAIWWAGAPVQDLGPHQGWPGALLEGEIGNVMPSCVVYCPELERRVASFSYPGDTETFGEGIRLTDMLGLKALGVNYEYLAPGKRSAFPHAHTHEEEFVFILKGKAKVWLDGFTREISAGDFAAFPSNTGIAHVIINDAESDVIYLCIGEAAEFPEEKLTYPLNPIRNEEGRKAGWLWMDPPKGAQGPHPGFPNKLKTIEFWQEFLS